MNNERLKGQWNQVVGTAKQTWSKITHDELLGIEGDLQRLAGLLQERYAVTREQAENEIHAFMLSLDKELGFDSANENGGQSTSGKRRSQGRHAA